MLLSMGIGLLSVSAGLTMSYYANLAPGGAIVLLAAAFAVAAQIGAPLLNRTR
jgi:ABC-type Mn2+/Zn2+ transport system permease subunit